MTRAAYLRGVLIRIMAGDINGITLSMLPSGPIQIMAVNQTIKKSIKAKTGKPTKIINQGFVFLNLNFSNLNVLPTTNNAIAVLKVITQKAIIIPTKLELAKSKLSVENTHDQANKYHPAKHINKIVLPVIFLFFNKRFKS